MIAKYMCLCVCVYGFYITFYLKAGPNMVNQSITDMIQPELITYFYGVWTMFLNPSHWNQWVFKSAILYILADNKTHWTKWNLTLE